ncbi:siphovirus Gp157 family protein [Pluralibacter gergoviae]
MKCMQTAELKTFKTERNTLTIRKGSPLVVIDDESQLPDELVNVKTIVTPDKLKIKEAIDFRPPPGWTPPRHLDACQCCPGWHSCPNNRRGGAP